MAEIDLTTLLVPTKISTQNDITTYDYVYLDSDADEIGTDEERQVDATDYAIINGADGDDCSKLSLLNVGKMSTDNQQCSYAILEHNGQHLVSVQTNGDVDYINPPKVYNRCIRPKIKIKLNNGILSGPEFINQQNLLNQIYERDGKHYVKLGEFPNSYVGDKLNSLLNRMFYSSYLINSFTGKMYSGSMIDESAQLMKYREYNYNDNKYVRVDTNFTSYYDSYSDGTKIDKKQTSVWVKVEPIEWEIVNYDTANINFFNSLQGKNENYLELRTTKGIISGIPFYPKPARYGYLWQNSSIRGYLNGINVNLITQNGNPNYAEPFGGDFTTSSFLYEAFNLPIKKLSAVHQEEVETDKKRKPQQSILNKKQEQQTKQKKAEEKIDDLFQKALAKYKEDHNIER